MERAEEIKTCVLCYLRVVSGTADFSLLLRKMQRKEEISGFFSVVPKQFALWDWVSWKIEILEQETLRKVAFLWLEVNGRMSLSTMMRISFSVCCRWIKHWEGKLPLRKREREREREDTTNWLNRAVSQCVYGNWLQGLTWWLLCMCALGCPYSQRHLVLSTCPLSGALCTRCLRAARFEAQSYQLMCSLSLSLVLSFQPSDAIDCCCR